MDLSKATKQQLHEELARQSAKSEALARAVAEAKPGPEALAVDRCIKALDELTHAPSRQAGYGSSNAESATVARVLRHLADRYSVRVEPMCQRPHLEPDPEPRDFYGESPVAELVAIPVEVLRKLATA